MQLNNIRRKTVRPASRRVGRGGKRGKTSGRGTKGQRARAGHRIRPEMRDTIKKLPKRRGFGKNRARTVNSARTKPTVVNVKDLSLFPAGSSVTPASLIEKGLISRERGRIPAVKILSEGDIVAKLTLSGFLYSAEARVKIEKAGGIITL